MILVDSGPLVALLSRNDAYHDACRETLRSVREPLGTVWPVMTEVMHLLRTSTTAQDTLCGFVEDGVLGLIPLDASDVPRMRALMAQFRDLPMDLADAALVRVAERDGIRRVFTIDRRDFSLYRIGKTDRFRIIP